MRLFMNGIKELDAKNTEEHIEIQKDYFSNSHLFIMHRGSISDIQLYRVCQILLKCIFHEN